MSNYQNKVLKWAAIIAIAFVCWVNAYPAIAATENFMLKSDRGYRLETNFTYDEPLDAIAIDSLQVRFYNSHDEMIASYDNIVDGKVLANYFKFDYDLDTHQPLGEIDLGGEYPGEIYLKGSVEEGFSWIEVMPTGEEMAMDTGQWTMSQN